MKTILHPLFLLSILLLCTTLSSVSSYAAPADRFANVEIKAQQVSGSVYMLEGSGGNIGVSVGTDGTLIVDDQYAPLADKISAALGELGGDRPRLVLNTHYHGDHTGSNPTFGGTGTIIAHDNVRVRLLDQEAFPRSGLPLVTYAENINVHFNDEDIAVIHVPQGHTDGDSIVWFKSANVVHMGDQFFNGTFPYIDVSSGGSVDGFIANIERVLAMVSADTKIIPGHGPLANVDDLKTSLATIKATSATIRSGLKQGKTADTIAEQLSEYANWGKGFISIPRWIQIIEADSSR